MIRAWLVAGFAASGTWVLAGAGWGLICGAVLVYVTWGQLTALADGLARVSAGLAAGWRYLRGVSVRGLVAGKRRAAGGW